MQEPNHARRILIAWLVLSVIVTPIVFFAIAPNLAPWEGSGASSGQVFDNKILFVIVTPIAAFMIVYFAYSLRAFRNGGDEEAEGVAIRGDSRVQTWWLVITTVIVLFLAIFGTAELADAGSGGGQGPSPVYGSQTNALPIQVIGQQWEFTYRFPTLGGFETPHLELPLRREIEFNVTSLDVIHSFWAPQLGVKADANPGVNNIAFVRPEEEEDFEIRCNELCGLWHGYMFDTGKVVSPRAFRGWIRQQRKVFGPVTKRLPKFETHYFPEPERRGG